MDEQPHQDHAISTSQHAFELTITRKRKYVACCGKSCFVYLNGEEVGHVDNGGAFVLRGHVGDEVQIRSTRREGIMVFSVDKPGNTQLNIKFVGN
jgi:hypothetical protein